MKMFIVLFEFLICLAGSFQELEAFDHHCEKFIAVPLVRQSTDYTCGAAAALSILGYFGEESLEVEVANELGTNEDYGTDFRQMALFFRKKGYQVSERQNMTIEEIEDHLTKGYPVLCLIQAWEEDVDYANHWSIGHYVIAIGYDKAFLYFMDPWVLGHYTYIPKEEFLKRWHQLTYDKITLTHWGMAVINDNPVYKPDDIVYTR